jgi:hypothetical protein
LKPLQLTNVALQSYHEICLAVPYQNFYHTEKYTVRYFPFFHIFTSEDIDRSRVNLLLSVKFHNFLLGTM